MPWVRRYSVKDLDVEIQMTMNRRKSLQVLATGTAGFLFSGPSAAQAFPSRPLTVVVPYPAGGPTDSLARTANVALSRSLGQPVIIENIGGASGVIALQKVLNAPADGYCLYRGSLSELVLAPLMMPSVRFRPDDFRLVQRTNTASVLAWLTRGDLSATSVQQFLAYAARMARERKPVTYASLGLGSFTHLITAHLSKLTKIEMTHVPYKGAAAAEHALLSGEVDFYLGAYLPKHQDYQKQGRMKVLALLNRERSARWRDIPAISETPQLKDFTFKIWGGYFVRKNTPQPVVQSLNRALIDTFRNPEVKALLDTLNQEPSEPLGVEASQRIYEAEVAQYLAFARNLSVQAR